MESYFEKKIKNKFYENGQSRSGFFFSRALRAWSRICRSPVGLLANYFSCVYTEGPTHLYGFLVSFHKSSVCTSFHLYLIFQLISIVMLFEQKHSSCASLKISLPREWGTSEAPETSVLGLLTRRIQWRVDPSLFGNFSSIFQQYLPKNEDWVLAPVDAPQQEIFVRGLGSVVDSMPRGKLIFCASVTDGQPSCIK